MPERPTDHSVRDLWELHEQTVRGASGGQILWQPRIGCWFHDKLFDQEPLPAPFSGLDRPAIFRKLGVSNRLYEYNACFPIVEDPQVVGRRERLDEWETLTTIETPVGTQTAIERTTPTNRGVIHVKRPIVTQDDLRVATWRAERATWRWDADQYAAVQATWGRLGAPTIYLPRVNVQDLYINTMGVEAAIYAMIDWPDRVEAYFRALDDLHERLIDRVVQSPIRIINFGDNLHGSTLSPDLFRMYVLPAYHRRLEKLHAGGCFVHSHWDGDCKPLLPFARETGLDGIEAITPWPQGDVTLAEVQDALGDMYLIDGIPAIYFDREWPISVLEDCVHELLERFAPRLILGISDELSSHGEIERIRRVTEIVDDYNAARAVTGASTPGGSRGRSTSAI